MGSLSINLRDNCSTDAENSSNGDDQSLTTRTSLLCLFKSSSFHSTTSTNDPSLINSSNTRSYSFSKLRSYSFSKIRSHRSIKKLCNIQTVLSANLPPAFSNALNHRKQETQETTSPVFYMAKTSTDQNIGVLDASPISTNISHVKTTNENAVDDESDAFSISFRSAKADQSQKNSDFSDTITWNQLGTPLSNVSPNSFNACDQQQLSSNAEFEGYDGKRKMGGVGVKKSKHSKRWKQTCMHFKLSSCPFNLLRKKQLTNFNEARNSKSDSIDGKSTSFSSTFFSCSSKSSYGDDIELTPPRKSALNPTAQMELDAEEGENEFWTKRILMGKRCRPLDFSGALHHCGKGVLLKEILEKG